MNASLVANQPSAPPIYALVLAGGHSTRMQRDKAALIYHGRTQLEWAVSFLQPHVERVFVSVRPDRRTTPSARASSRSSTREEPRAHRRHHGRAGEVPRGRMAGARLRPAVPRRGHADNLDRRAQTRSVSPPRSARVTTCFPEPLCAIYEPASREAILAHVASGKNCPRKFLINSDVQLLDEPNPHALDNVNTPDEYGSAVAALSPTEIPGAPNVDAATGARARRRRTARATRAPSAVAATRSDKRIKVQYYAILREQAGRSDESVVTGAHTPRDLYNELKSRYPFSLAPEMLRVAVNAEFGEWSQRLADGDSVVFIPPVAGG